ncbi:MAG: chromosome segregation protein SMC [Bacillota bacterium]
MHLKSLELRGFKSFAKGIEVVFRPGVNVIVGPNGCGKSNIADAIRWVLGEANIRNLRGQRGEDVIFTGTDKKKPLGMATVSMTLDNQDHLINSDYSEINITRRVYRTGDSEFLINLNEVRLKDIHSLLAGTGLGKRGYSIIGQGELEQVLDAKPFERRLIIEEAAGLSGYRQKKDEAEAKLHASSQDLIRLEDILGEVKLRVAELEEKAEKARNFKRLDSERGYLERRIIAYDLFLLNRELQSRDRDLTSLKAQLAEAKAREDEQEQGLRETEEMLRVLREDSADTREKMFTLVTRMNQQGNETRLSQERIDHARERLAQIETDIAKYGDTMNKLDQDLDSHRQELTLKEVELQAKRREAELVEEEIRTVEDEYRKAGLQLESLKTRLIDHLSTESTYKNQRREKEEHLRKNQEKLELGRTDNQYRQQTIENWQETLASLDHGLAEGEALLNRLNRDKEQLETKRQCMADETAELEKQLASLQDEIRGLHQQVLTLEDGIHSHTGMSEGVRRLINAIRKDKQLIPGFLGVLADLIEVPPGLEVAVEAAAGRSLENIVVRDHEDAKAAIKLLKLRSWGRVTFLPLSMLRSHSVDRRQLDLIKNISGVLGLATHLVRYSPDYRKAVEHVLGQVLIVENLDIGLQVFQKHPRLRIVTIEGDIINPTGAMTGGRYQGRISPLHIRTSYREKKREMEAANSRLQNVVSSLEKQRSITKELDAKLARLQQSISETVFQQDIQRKERDRVGSELEKAMREVSQFLAEERIAAREIASLERELSQLTAQYNDVQSQIVKIESELEEQRLELNRISRHLDLLRERQSNYSDLVSICQRELEGRRQSMEQLMAVKKSYETSMEDYQRQITRFTQVIEVEEKRIRSLEVEKERTHQELEEIERLLEDLNRKTTASQNRAVTHQEAAEALHQQVTMLEEKIKQLEIRKARIETEEKNVLSLWEERFAGESYCDLWEGMDSRQQRSMRQRFEVVKQAIEELGPVNVTAIDELDEVNQRFVFLRNQLEDLHQARQALTKIIEDTEEIMNTRFRDFLVVANSSFKKTFNSIFQGGDAELILENHDDHWQSGVEIMVKMPGKRRQSLNLLSGGERALTCIAFIFSLLILKPTPFCLFDEVDSSLDDANLTRFTEFLKRLADRMQFIVITHRQGTVEVADNIFGVTMPEQGMSEVYSLRSKEVESMAG